MKPVVFGTCGSLTGNPYRTKKKREAQMEEPEEMRLDLENHKEKRRRKEIWIQ